MPTGDLPAQGTAEGGALSFDEGADAISNLLQDSETNLPGEIEANQAEDQTDQPEDGAEVEVDADAEIDGQTEQEPDGSETYEKGRFAADTAKVTLDDGTVITVADLKRNNLYQRDYTRKTTELAEERKNLDGHREKLTGFVQSLTQQRDFILQAAQQFLPKAPDRSLMESDPLGYVQAKAVYDDQMQVVNRLAYQRNAEMQRQQDEQAEAKNKRRAEEGRKLIEAIPEFKDTARYNQFWTEATATMAEQYGFTQDELANTDDHRLYRAMRDLVAFHKAKKQAPQVKQAMQNKPPVMTGGKRMDPKAKISRDAQARTERLRKSGSLEDGIAALLDLNL